MNHDLVRRVRVWAGYLLMSLAHQVARLGNLAAGTRDELVEPARPPVSFTMPGLLACGCTSSMRATGRRCEACVWDDEHPPGPALRLTRRDQEIVHRLIDTEMRP